MTDTTQKTAPAPKTPASNTPDALRRAWPVLTVWGNDKADGPAPSDQNLADALAAGCRAGSGQGLALAMTLRDVGSTRAQRVRANTSGNAYGSKPADNVGGLGDALRTKFGKGFNFDPAQVYRVTQGKLTLDVTVGPHTYRKAVVVRDTAPATAPDTAPPVKATPSPAPKSGKGKA